jgi:hypothetical protein
MVWKYLSPIPVGRRGVIYLLKGFLSAVTGLEEGGRGSAQEQLWVQDTDSTSWVAYSGSMNSLG